MISTLIIHSNKDQAELIGTMINRVPLLYLVNIFDSPDVGFEFASKSQVDLLFIDGQNAKTLAEGGYTDLIAHKRIIIFSASPEDAVIAFNCNAVDFLTYPVSFDRFMTAILKIQNYFKLISQQKDPDITSIDSKEKGILFLRTGTAIQKININEITFLEKEGNYFHIHSTQTKPFLVRINFERLINLLPGNQFLRVHKSFIISLYHIDKIENDEILIGSNKIPISASYKDIFLEYIKSEFRFMNFKIQKPMNSPAA